MTIAGTARLRLKTYTTRRTDDVPDFTQRRSSPAARTEADETIEDGRAMRLEIARYQSEPSESFVELDEFFKSIG